MRKFILKFMFPGSLEAYDEANKIHFVEMRVYRRRWYFLLGCLLFLVPALMIIRSGSWPVKIGILSMAVGFVFVRDTITEHFCLKLLREHKAQSR